MNATPDTGRALASGVYDPAVESDGLTIDTPTGPVDLIAIDRALAGRRVALTPAERDYAVSIARTVAELRAVSVALGMHPETIERGIYRARQAVAA